MNIPLGLCQCGCGNKTNIISSTNVKDGRIKGAPSRFLPGHNGRLQENILMLKGLSARGEKSPSWKGGKTIDSYGYLLTNIPDYNENVSNYVRDHILIVERVIGKRLPLKAVVHHVDGNRLNNSNSNLVVCEGQGYHTLLHRRARGARAGNANMIRCPLCKTHDHPENMHVKSNGQGRHRACHTRYELIRRGVAT